MLWCLQTRMNRIFHTNIKAYCNIKADSGNHDFTCRRTYNYYNHYLAYYRASRHVICVSQQHFLVIGYFPDRHTHTNTQTRSDTLCVARGDAADCLLLHVFLRGVEEDRNGQENTQRQRRGRRRKKRRGG